MYVEVPFESLVGEVITEIPQIETGISGIKFLTASGKIFKIVSHGSFIDVIIGDVLLLIGHPITSILTNVDVGINESGTWLLTVIQINTNVNSVTLSWMGKIEPDVDTTVVLYEYKGE